VRLVSAAARLARRSRAEPATGGRDLRQRPGPEAGRDRPAGERTAPPPPARIDARHPLGRRRRHLAVYLRRPPGRPAARLPPGPLVRRRVLDRPPAPGGPRRGDRVLPRTLAGAFRLPI